MTALNDARIHLAKAREFLDAAILTNDHELYSAATSNAVTSAINSKDAICFMTTGRTNKSDNHADAVRELQQSSAIGRRVSPALQRLLKLKPKSQYGEDHVSAANAASAVGWAQVLYDAAVSVVPPQ